MYACVHEIGRGFFAGVCERKNSHTVFATHPYLSIRELFYARTVSGGSRRSESLFTTPISCSWQ